MPALVDTSLYGSALILFVARLETLVCLYPFPTHLLLSCADLCNGAVAWISRQIRIPGTQFAAQFICFASTRVQILTREELLCLRNYNKGAGSIKVLNLLALLIQKYKFRRIRWCRVCQSLCHMYVYVCMCLCVCVCVCVCMYIFIYIWSMYVCMYVYRYTNIYIYIYIYI